MKKKLSLPFKIFLGILAFCLVNVLLVLLWAGLDRMKGTIRVTINGEVYEIDDLRCTCRGNEDKIHYKTRKGITKYHNQGSSYGVFTYTFTVEVDGMVLTPEFNNFKTNWREFWDACDITLELTKDGDIWKAKMVMEDDCSDVVKEIIVGEEELSIQMGP